jgi:glycosyltransferase involved in cell wall biosynthesis
MNIEQKSILIFVFNLSYGGAEWVVANICNELARKNVNVTLVSVKGGDLINEVKNNVLVKEFNGNYLKSILFIFKNLLIGKYNAIFSTQRVPSVIISAVHMMTLSKSNLIIREAASNFNNSLKKYRIIKKKIYQFAYRRANHIICNSTGTRNDLINAGIINENNNITVINNPLDISLIQNKSKENINNDIDNNKFTVVYVGRLVPKKNVDIIIKAFKTVNNIIKNSQLIIIGDGVLKNELMRLSIENGLKDSIIFLGHLKNPYPIIAKSDVLVLVSKWEGFGMVVVEALALGIPVIASDIESGPREILDRGKYGLLVGTGCEESLSAAILKIKNKKYSSEILQKRAAEFDKHIIIEKYYNVLFK